MENQKKPSLLHLIIGGTASILIAFGTFSKLMHWPGASVMLIFGYGLFCLFYLPLWLMNEPKKGRKLMLFSQFVILLIACFASLFKTMHWPGGGLLYNLWLYLTLFIVLPVFIILVFRSGSKSLQQFHTRIVLLLLISLIIGGISGSASRMTGIATSFSKNTVHLKNTLTRIENKNNQLYEAFKGGADTNNSFYYKSVQLRNLSAGTRNYIRKLRNHLISSVEQVSESAADSLDISDLTNLTDNGISTEILCGQDEYKPRTGEYSGLELKSVIATFRDSVITFTEGENRNFIKAGMNLDTEPLTNENDGEPEDWVFATFRNVPISAVLQTLENMNYEILNTETEVLTDLLNSYKQNSGNLATKVAELGSKLEDEKKQREIEKLKSDRELAKINLDMKNQALDEQQKTIIWFIVGFILCSVMLFFIIRSNILRKKINSELQSQKQITETKNKEITDSINYAKRIQQAILPPDEILHETFHESFVLYQPKDVVSGDFYGFFKKEDYFIIAVADCTGHGVPGAFMSMIGHEQLSRIIIEKNITTPAIILDELHQGVRKALKQDHSSGESRDGMDIALCKIYLTQNKIEYAGANRPLWIIRNNELTETKADKQPIGGLETDNRKQFTNHLLHLEKNDSLYLFTDGYADQFGGDRGKKFMVKNLERLLIELFDEKMKNQQTAINEKFIAWKGSNEQVDDVLIIGIRI